MKFSKENVADFFRLFQEIQRPPEDDLYRYLERPPQAQVYPPNPNQAANAMDWWLKRISLLPFSGPFVNATGANRIRGLLG